MNKFVTVLMYVFLIVNSLSPNSFATETICCTAGNFGLMFHIGSEGIADLQIYCGPDVASGDFYSYGQKDFDVIGFAWKSDKMPYKGNKIVLIRSKKTEEKPSLTLKVNGGTGKLIFRGRIYPVRCSW